MVLAAPLTMPGLTFGDIVTVVSLLGTIALLIMNLRVKSAVADAEAQFTAQVNKVHLEIANARAAVTQETAGVKLEIANLRAKFAEEGATMYQKIMENMENTFENRQVSQSMHAANSKRLDDFGRLLERMDEKIDRIDGNVAPRK